MLSLQIETAKAMGRDKGEEVRAGGCARGEFQWHSNHAGSLVSPGNICIVLLRIHSALLGEDGSLSSLLVSNLLAANGQSVYG